MELEKREICEYNLLKSNLVFVDGLTRVGKSMLNTVLGSLEKVSHPQFIEPLEQLLPMYKTGHIDKNATSAFLRLYLNEKFYNYKLSRNINFRYDDLTSIHNSTDSVSFFKNLSRVDGDEVINDLKSCDIIHQYQTHDVLTQFSIFKKLEINVKMIELFRNPIDTIHSWYKRGWGKRFDNEDPRSFTSLYRFGDKTMPHYAIGHESEYFKLNEMEKCVFLHNKLLKSSLSEFNKLNKEEKMTILIVKYEDFLINPNDEVMRICNFLNTTTTVYTEKALKKASLPRSILLTERTSKLEEIKNSVNKELYIELNNIVNEYDNNFYGLEK